MTTCKNCNTTFEGNFCNNCGQKAKTARLDWSYISDEAKYTFLHFNGGLTYTIKQLMIRPGATVSDFIDGKRVKHYKPLLLVFVLAGFYGLLMHYVDVGQYFEDSERKQIYLSGNDWIISHYSLVEVAMLPIAAFSSWLAFRKSGYNFIENVILNAFTSSLKILFGLAMIPILILFSNSPVFSTVYNLTFIFQLVLIFVVYFQFFRKMGTAKVIVRTIISIALQLLLLVLIFGVMITIDMMVNPEKFAVIKS